jgi:hypothetical protein
LTAKFNRWKTLHSAAENDEVELMTWMLEVRGDSPDVRLRLGDLPGTCLPHCHEKRVLLGCRLFSNSALLAGSNGLARSCFF